VDASRVREFHYITPTSNLQSIMTHGLLSNHLVARLPHASVANQSIQDTQRSGKRIPNGLLLHDYVNLYFDARNAMMFILCKSHSDLVVLRIEAQVMNTRDAVVSDRNAAAGAAAFYPSPAGLQYLDEERVYAESWFQGPDGSRYDEWEKYDRKQQRQAELLVPHRVEAQSIKGMYVRYRRMVSSCGEMCPTLAIEVNKYVFFE